MMSFQSLKTKLVLVLFIINLLTPFKSFAAKPATSPEVEAQLLQLQQQLSDLEKKFEELGKKTEANATQNPTSGYDGGFFIQSPDGNFKFVINGGVILRYLVGFGQAQQDRHSISVGPTLNFSGNLFNPNLNFSMALSPAASAILQGADISYTINDHLTLGGGYNSLALDVGLLGASGTTNQFVTTAMAVVRYGTDSVGVGATGEIVKGIGYSIGIQNGQGNGFKSNTNSEMSYFAQLNWQPLGAFGSVSAGDAKHSEKPLVKFELGGNYSNEETAPEQRIIQGTAGGGIKFKGVNFYTQGFTLLTDPDDFTQQQIDFSVFAQLGYYIVKNKFEVAVRYSALFDDLNSANINYNSGFASLLGGAGDVDGDSEDEYAYSFAMAYNISGTKLRSVAEYTYWYDGRVGQDTVNHLIRLHLHAKF